MYPSEPRNPNMVGRPVHRAVALVALGIPIVSLALLGTLPVAPMSIDFQSFVKVAMPAVLGLNSANLLLFLVGSRRRMGPQLPLSLWSIGAVFSGVCVSTALVFAGFFAILGG